jgi:hypothetical protein
MSESWDTASGTRNASSRISDPGLASMHDMGMGSEKLTGQPKAGPSVAFGVLAWEHLIVFSILLHLFQLALNGNGLVNQMLKIWVVGVEQLKLDLVIETLEERILLLLVGVDIIGVYHHN